MLAIGVGAVVAQSDHAISELVSNLNSNEANIVSPTSSNTFGCNMLASFELYVG